MRLVDTHCHLTHERFAGDADLAVARAEAAGVAACVTIGTGIDDARRALALAARHAGRVFCSAGLDPFTSHRLGAGFDGAMRELEGLLRGGGFVALGEVGLDYHYDLDPRAIQASRFERQLELAAALDLPVIVHVREAHEDTIAILSAHPQNRGVIHSFTAGPGEARRYLELGWHLAFNGVATFPSAPEVLEAARRVPPERLLVETDSPYLAPAPHRGRRCEPAYAAITLRRIAEARGEAAEDVAASSTSAATALFGLGGPSAVRC